MSDSRDRAGPPRRVVLDTNVLVGAAYAARSASRRILEACLRGDLAAVTSPALQREYARILPRAVRLPGGAASLARLLEMAECVEPAQTPRVVPEDPEDDKLLAAALAGRAGAVVTSDGHLLRLDPFHAVRILRPTAFVRFWLPG